VLLVWTLGAGAVGGAAASAAVRVSCCWCGPWVLVPLEGPLQVLLSECRVLCALWSLYAGAAAGCRCRVPLQGTSAWRCCQSAGCRWCGTWVLPLQEVRCEMSMAVQVDTSHQKRRMFGCCPKKSFAIAKTGLNP